MLDTGWNSRSATGCSGKGNSAVRKMSQQVMIEPERPSGV